MGRKHDRDEDEAAYELEPRMKSRYNDEERRRNRLPTLKNDTAIKQDSIVPENAHKMEEVKTLINAKVKRRLEADSKLKADKDAKKAKLEAEKKADPFGLSKLQTIPQRQQKMVELCTSLLADPVKAQENLDVLFSLYALEKSVVRRESEISPAQRNVGLIRAHTIFMQQVFMSIVATIKDIIPNYKVGQGGREEALEKAKDAGVRLSKRVEDELASEKKLLDYYNRLLDILKKDFIGNPLQLRLGIEAAAALIENAPQFNRRDELLKILTNQSGANDPIAADRSQRCLESLLASDADLDIAAELTKFMGEVAKQRPNQLSARSLSAISTLNLAAKKAAADREWKSYGELNKVSEDVRRDLLMGAIHDPKKVRTNERVILTECIIVIVRVIRNPKSFADDVLPAALRGLATHAIHVNNEMLGELMTELAKLSKKDSGVDAEARLSSLDSWLRLAKMAHSNNTDFAADLKDKKKSNNQANLMLPDPTSVSESLVALIQEGSIHFSCGEYIHADQLNALLGNQQAQMSTYALHQYVANNASTMIKSFLTINNHSSEFSKNSHDVCIRTDFLRRLCGCVEATSESLASKHGESHALAVGRIIEALLGAAVVSDTGVCEELLGLAYKVLRRHGRVHALLEDDGLIISPLVPPMTVKPVLVLLLSHISVEVRMAAKKILELPDSMNKAPSATGGVMGGKWGGLGLKRAGQDLEWLLTRETQGAQSNIMKDILKFKQPCKGSSNNNNDDDDDSEEDVLVGEEAEWNWMLEPDSDEEEIDEEIGSDEDSDESEDSDNSE